MRPMRPMRPMLALLPLIPQLVVLSHASAQERAPWIATLSMTRKALAVGECSAVALDLKSAKSEWPRGPNGQLVSMSDFDFSVSAPSARSAVGKYDGASSFSVCACPKAPAGTVATVAATYPSRWIAPKVRVPGVAFTTTTSVPIVAGASSGNAPGCDASGSSTRGAWLVTVQPTVSALAIGGCSAVSLTIRDSTGKDTPRGPSGQRVSIADFDMSATTANGVDVVGKQDGASIFSACACQTGTVGEAATITAKYPGSQLDAKLRVPGVEMQAMAPLTLAAARGSTNPPGCGLKQRAIASIAPRSAAQGATATGGAAGAAGSVGSEKAEAAQSTAAGNDPRAQEEAPSAGGAAGAAAGAVSAGSQKAGDAQGSAAGSDPRAQGEAPSAGGAATAGGAGAASQKAGDAQGSAAGSDPRAQGEAPSAGGAATAGAAGAAGAGSQKAGDAQGSAATSDPHAQAEAPGAVATAPTSRGAPSALKGPLTTAPSTTRSTPFTAPAPTGVAVAWTRGVAHVTWNSVNGAQRYAVWRANGTASSVERTPSAYSLTQFADSIADVHETYRYVVIAYFADGSKGASPTVQFTPSSKSKP